MIKQKAALIFILFFPVYAYGSSFVDVGAGVSNSNIIENKLGEGLSIDSEKNKTGTIISLSIGRSILKRLSLSIQYVEFSDTLDLYDGFIEQESYAYGLAVSLDLYQSEKVNFEGGIGFEKWYSKTYIPQGHFDFSGDRPIFIFEDKTFSDNGYAPFIFFNLQYPLNKSLSLGFKYEHHFQQSYTTAIINKDKLAMGDITGAIEIGLPIDFSVDLYTLFLRWSF